MNEIIYELTKNKEVKEELTKQFMAAITTKEFKTEFNDAICNLIMNQITDNIDTLLDGCWVNIEKEFVRAIKNKLVIDFTKKREK